ncbi:retrovirus-related pol polyprotein from transposon RE1, partial [Tanacetum coccineum]
TYSLCSSYERKKWCDDMKKEIGALESNGTWELKTLPPRKKAICCKWVYKTKYNNDGTIQRHRARLVIYKNRQHEGVDYKETFAPVAKMVIVKTFLSVAATKKWELHQMDIKNQHIVFRSSTEAEYRIMATTIRELKWLKGLLHSFGVVHSRPMKLLCDSQAAIPIAANPVFHERTKHIEVDSHFIRDEIQSRNIVIENVQMTEKLIDIFTKALGK